MKKIYIFKHNPNPNALPLPHSFAPGTFAMNSHSYNPLFQKILDAPLQCDTMVEARSPDIIFVDNQAKEAKIIGIAIPGDPRVIDKELENIV